MKGLLIAVLLSLVASHVANSQSIFLNPSNSALPAWNGTCPAGYCTSASPCTLPNITNTADSSCQQITFKSGSVLSGFSLTGAFGAYTYISTEDNTVTTGSQPVTISTYGALTAFTLTINAGAPLIYHQTSGLAASSNVVLTLAPGANATVDQMYCVVGCVINTTSTAAPMPFIYSITNLNLAASSISNVNISANQVTLSLSSVNNSIIRSLGFSYTIQNSALANSSISGPITTLASTSSSYVNTTISGPITTATFTNGNVSMPSGSTFLSALGTSCSLTLTSFGAYSSSGSTANATVALYSGQISIVTLTSVTSPVWNWANMLAASFYIYTSSFYGSQSFGGPSLYLALGGTTHYCYGANPCLNIGSPGQSTTITGTAYPIFYDVSGCEIQYTGSVSYGYFGTFSSYAVASACANPATNATVSGGYFTVGQSINSGGALTFSTAQPVILNTITIGSLPALAIGSLFTYQPTNLSTPIVSATSISAATVAISWLTTGPQPLLEHAYPLIQTTGGATSAISAISVPYFNASLSSVGAESFFTFHAVTCMAHCDIPNLSGPCTNTQTCPCQAPWGGPWCDCDTTYLPPNAQCSSSGGPNYVLGLNSYISSPVYLPAGYTMAATVGVTFATEVTINQSTIIGYPASYTSTAFYGPVNIYTNLTNWNNNGTCLTNTQPAFYSSLSYVVFGPKTLYVNATEFRLFVNNTVLWTNTSCLADPAQPPMISSTNIIGPSGTSASLPVIPVSITFLNASESTALNMSFPFITAVAGLVINITTPNPAPGLYACQVVSNGAIYIQISNATCPVSPVPMVPVIAPVPHSASPTPVLAPIATPTAPVSSPVPTMTPTTAPEASPVPVSSVPSPTPVFTPSAAPSSRSFDILVVAALLVVCTALF